MTECPKCGKQAETGETGNYYYCQHCLSMGDLEEQKKRYGSD